jgi:hypothetical protein
MLVQDDYESEGFRGEIPGVYPLPRSGLAEAASAQTSVCWSVRLWCLTQAVTIVTDAVRQRWQRGCNNQCPAACHISKHNQKTLLITGVSLFNQGILTTLSHFACRSSCRC